MKTHLLLAILCCSLSAFAQSEGAGAEARLTRAIREVDSASIKKCLLEGADPNTLCDGVSALELAARDGNCELIKLLIEKGITKAVINRPDQVGRVPVAYAAWKGSDSCSLSELLAAGADASLANREGWTPLHYAALNGAKEKVSLILENSKDPDVATKSGITPAMIAIRSAPEVYQYLQAKGAAPVDLKNIETLVRVTAAEIALLDNAIDEEAIYNARTGEDPVVFARLATFLPTESELVKNQGKDPFGNSYVLSDIKSGPRIAKTTVDLVKAKTGSIPSIWEGYLPESKSGASAPF